MKHIQIWGHNEESDCATRFFFCDHTVGTNTAQGNNSGTLLWETLDLMNDSRYTCSSLLNTFDDTIMITIQKYVF